MTEQKQPTKEELIAEYKANRRKELQDIASQTSFQGKPQLSYEQMKDEFDRRRGVARGWSSPTDNVEHDISQMPRPSEGKPQKSYSEMRAEWFSLQGRRDPAIAKKQHDQKYSR